MHQGQSRSISSTISLSPLTLPGLFLSPKWVLAHFSPRNQRDLCLPSPKHPAQNADLCLGLFHHQGNSLLPPSKIKNRRCSTFVENGGEHVFHSNNEKRRHSEHSWAAGSCDCSLGRLRDKWHQYGLQQPSLPPKRGGSSAYAKHHKSPRALGLCS